MRRGCSRSLLGCVVFCFAVGPHGSAVSAEAPSNSIDEIRGASSNYLAALGSGDAERIAACWTPQGTFVDADNNRHQARQLIQQEFPREATPSKVKPTAENQLPSEAANSTIRFITPDVALEQATMAANESGPGPNSVNGDSPIKHVALWVKHDNKWLLDYLQEFHSPAIATENPLADLGWMVGEWEASSQGIDARLTVTWSEQRNFLLQGMVARLPDQEELRVEQRLTWDAANKVIRSWMFRSDGGFAEGVWTLRGDTWVVKQTEVTSAGESFETINLWVYEEPGAFWFKSLTNKSADQPAREMAMQFRRADSHRIAKP